MGRTSWRFGFLTVVASLIAGVGPVASADVAPPNGWPNTALTKPMIEGWPNALRISGLNRYQTGLAAALTLRGSGNDESYPFGSPDPATTKGWWGLGSCPRSIIVVAGDSPADALAASSLSDPTGLSTEPLLQRSAAADPLFYPPGGFARVDTDFAPILATTSARSGATGLDVATRLAAQDLRSGGCSAARQAIIVGGTRAVASSVDTELLSIGYEQVFRVAGSSRYATARLIAQSLGTAPLPGGFSESSCLDSRVDDGSARTRFYANSVIEYRPSARSCRLLSRTAVLTDGVTGADALAAGWWTSYWQVPVLLHDGSGDLPRQTSEALETLGIDHLIVLGGTSRISTAVADEALETSGADEVIRIAGDDRYGTSVEMARVFGGWWPSDSGSNFEGSVLCLAASSGQAGAGGTGWPDALAAGPWCARASSAATGGPTRALMPIDGDDPTLSSVAGDLSEPARALVPVLLVPTGATSLPATVTSMLSGAFASGDGWCSGDDGSNSCLVPGFAVAFGGRSVVSDTLLETVSRLVAGGDSAAGSVTEPSLTSTFVTRLDLSPVFDAPTGELWACAERGAYEGVRWLVAEADSLTTNDVYLASDYARDPDGVTRSPATGAPACVAVDVGDGDDVRVRAAGPTSRSTPPQHGASFSLDPDRWLTLDGPIGSSAPTETDGVDSADDSSEGGSTTWTYVSNGTAVTVSALGSTARVESGSIVLALVRGENSRSTTGPDTFSAEITLTTGRGTVKAQVSGEAILAGGVWSLRGQVEFENGSWRFDSGSGGFAAELTVSSPGDLTDDSLEWRLDGVGD